MTRIITLAREYGSGGGAIAERVAATLGWKLVDRDLIADVARLARVSPADAASYDERTATWVERLAKTFWSGGPESFVGTPRNDVLDADRMAELTREVVLRVADAGGCVIVGRGGVCILQDRPDAFHVFVFAPRDERRARVRARYASEAAAAAALDDVDHMRASYVQRYYGCERADRRLYDLLINSRLGLERTAAAIVCAAGLKSSA